MSSKSRSLRYDRYAQGQAELRTESLTPVATFPIHSHQFHGQRSTQRLSFILSGCDTHGALEVADEMALVIETQRFGDMGQGHALAQQGDYPVFELGCVGGSRGIAAAVVE